MRTIEWVNGKVRLIDQTRLPLEAVWIDCASFAEVAAAIREMRVRGAPAIGVAAAYGVALAAHARPTGDRAALDFEVARAAEVLAATRPTAVNLFWAIERMHRSAEVPGSADELRGRLLAEAEAIAAEDEQACRTIGVFGAALLAPGSSVLTHCNAGALATAGYGTALGVIRAAHAAGKGIQVYVDETRPLLQGARLTAWELVQEQIPATLIADNMAGALMQQGKIDAVVVGADRIAANGDVANKIGTYTVAVLAKEHRIPFFVAAPTSTIDLAIPNGAAIPIEERRPEEVTHLLGVQIAPAGIRVANPAFDVTPHRYVAAIVTEQGVLREPYGVSLAAAVGAAEAGRRRAVPAGKEE